MDLSKLLRATSQIQTSLEKKASSKEFIKATICKIRQVVPCIAGNNRLGKCSKWNLNWDKELYKRGGKKKEQLRLGKHKRSSSERESWEVCPIFLTFLITNFTRIVWVSAKAEFVPSRM